MNAKWEEVLRIKQVKIKKNIQPLSKCLLYIKLAVGTLKLSEIGQEISDEISIAKS